MVHRSSRSGMKSPEPATAGIGAAVRVERLKHGLTQSQLAGLAGTGLRFISDLERGKPSVALDKVVMVLAVLGLQLRVVGGQT